MSLIVGRRPAWLRVLLVPSQPFHETLGAPDGQQITDPVSMRFDAGLKPLLTDPTKLVSTEWVLSGTALPDGRIVFFESAATVNEIIDACGTLSRRVRVTIGDLTWGAGYFEIDGEW